MPGEALRVSESKTGRQGQQAEESGGGGGGGGSKTQLPSGRAGMTGSETSTRQKSASGSTVGSPT
jgi:hypothetical protein